MARQTLAENWRIEQIFYDQEKADFCITSQPLGKFMRATAIEKVADMAKSLGYQFKASKTHGSSGHWFNNSGATITLLPYFGAPTA